jgi:hypothetical protein
MNSRQGYPQPAAVCPSNKPKNRCYFNERIEQLLNQARKYKVGLALGRSTSGFTRPTACDRYFRMRTQLIDDKTFSAPDDCRAG